MGLTKESTPTLNLKHTIVILSFSSRAGTDRFDAIKSPLCAAELTTIPTPTGPGDWLLTSQLTFIPSIVHRKVIIVLELKLALNPNGVRTVEIEKKVLLNIITCHRTKDT